jgi:hypothetical protein
VKFYDIHSVSLEYFGYTLVMFRRPVRRFLVLELRDEVGRVAQSVYRLATGWTVRGSNTGVGEIFRTCPDRPCGSPSFLYDGYRGATLSPHLVPSL